MPARIRLKGGGTLWSTTPMAGLSSKRARVASLSKRTPMPCHFLQQSLIRNSPVVSVLVTGFWSA